jgi:hypothetical protein
MNAASALDRLLDPVGRCLTPEVARALVALRADAETQARIDELADKCTEGTLSPTERAEYEAYVAAIDFLTILQAKARGTLEQAAGAWRPLLLCPSALLASRAAAIDGRRDLMCGPPGPGGPQSPAVLEAHRQGAERRATHAL